MKKIILAIITLAALNFGATAQNVNIPDANFKNYLVQNTSINTNMDSEIQLSEAHAFSGNIFCQSLGITDLTGIEEFTSITYLGCNDNLLTTLNLGPKPNLTALIISNNNLNSINISQCPVLTFFQGSYNNLTTIDLSQNTVLDFFECRYNNLENLDVSQNTVLTKLDCIDNNISSIDLSQNTDLTFVDLAHNNLTTIDVTQNIGLTTLSCFYNNLSTLDVSQNTALSTLQCNQNSIVSLDVSQSPDLTNLYCGNNNLTSLKLKNLSSSTMQVVNTNSCFDLICIEVDDVAAATANITFLNIDNWTSLSTSCEPVVNIPDANFKAYLVGNSSINTNSDTEIQVSEAETFSGTINCQNQNISDLTGIEAFTSLTELGCLDNNLTSLDVSQNTALTKLTCGNNPLGSLDVSQNTALEELQTNNNNLTSLDVSNNLSLFRIICPDNNLTSLDVSQNTNLYLLSVANNNLTSLDLSQNTNLEVLQCVENHLSSLDVSQNVNLNNFSCTNNNLSSLNMKNLNISAFSFFDATLNPNLTCIDVDDVAAAMATWTNIDVQTSFSENCNFVPVTSISVQGQGGATTISTLGGTLQMEAEVFPMNATNATYTWSVINLTGSADIDTNGLLTALTDGTVKVGVTANDGSGVTGSVNITISNQSSSIGEISNTPKISIFPNPTNGQINFDTKTNIKTVRVMSVMGKTVKTIVAPNQVIDVSELTKGIYFLQIQVDNTLVSKKIIKD